MTTPLSALAVTVVRAWTRAYTWRLPPAARDARRAEIDSDLWELQRDRDAHARLHPAAHIAVRWLLGIRDDLAWRVTQRRARTGTRRVALTVAALALGTVVATGLWLLPLLLPAKLPVPPNMMRFVAVPPPPPPMPAPPPPPPR